jgi:periplasmic protein TonB
MVVDTYRYIEQSKYGRFGHYLHTEHFVRMLLLALGLHIGGLVLYSVLPHDRVQEIPVRTLNVKLGGISDFSNAGNVASSEPASVTPAVTPQFEQLAPVADASPPSPAPNADAVLSTLEEQLATPKQESFKKVEAKPKPKPKAENKPLDPVEAVRESMRSRAEQNMAKPRSQPSQYVRENKSRSATITKNRSNNPAATNSGAANGSAYGNSAQESAEIEKRYTQTLSLWLEKHKIYPVEAQQQRQQGRAVLRIRIDRRGNVLYWGIEQSTGHELIDRSLGQIVSAANPFPPVPANYPDPGSVLEYLIAITFKL